MMLYRLHVVAHDVAIAVDSYTRPDAGDLDALSARCTDVLVWGESPQAQEAYEHPLSGAGRAFKSAAMTAAGAPDVEVGATEVCASPVAGRISMRA